jgi:hypothetical protein
MTGGPDQQNPRSGIGRNRWPSSLSLNAFNNWRGVDVGQRGTRNVQPVGSMDLPKKKAPRESVWGARAAMLLSKSLQCLMREGDWRLHSTGWFRRFRRFRRFTRAASRARNGRGVQRCREKDSDRGRGYRSEFSATGEKPSAVLVSAHVRNLVVVRHFPSSNLPQWAGSAPRANGVGRPPEQR